MIPSKPKVPNPPNRVALGKAPPKLTVACVWWGDRYPAVYVERLRNMVERNLRFAPYDFVCITPHKEVPDGVLRIRPRTDAATWWQKVGLFDPDLFGPSQRILYLDLDIVIKGSLHDIARSQDAFCMLDNFGPNRGYCAHNSSVMLWTPTEKSAKIFTDFTPDVMKGLHGDQDWIWYKMREDIRCFAEGLCQSYKYDKIDDQSSVVVFHGEPKQTAVKDPFVLANWV